MPDSRQNEPGQTFGAWLQTVPSGALTEPELLPRFTNHWHFVHTDGAPITPQSQRKSKRLGCYLTAPITQHYFYPRGDDICSEHQRLREKGALGHNPLPSNTETEHVEPVPCLMLSSARRNSDVTLCGKPSWARKVTLAAGGLCALTVTPVVFGKCFMRTPVDDDKLVEQKKQAFPSLWSALLSAGRQPSVTQGHLQMQIPGQMERSRTSRQAKKSSTENK